MEDKTVPNRYVVGYYGLLQSAHLVVLLRAGLIFLQSQRWVFPVSPPPQGWTAQVIPFFFGMGLVDAIAAGIGVALSVRYLVSGVFDRDLAVVSLTTAFASAAVFAAGTLASGAWAVHALEYASMVVLFFPLLPLFVAVMRGDQR